MLFLEDALEEYEYHCLARSFTDKTMKNKRQGYKQLHELLTVRRGIERLDSITTHDMKAYIRTKHNDNLQASSIISMAKQVSALFNWCVAEEYLGESSMKGVALPNKAVKNVNMLVIGKGRRERIVYISPALRQMLIKYERIKRSYFKDKLVKSDSLIFF